MSSHTNRHRVSNPNFPMASQRTAGSRTNRTSHFDPGHHSNQGVMEFGAGVVSSPRAGSKRMPPQFSQNTQRLIGSPRSPDQQMRTNPSGQFKSFLISNYDQIEDARYKVSEFKQELLALIEYMDGLKF